MPARTRRGLVALATVAVVSSMPAATSAPPRSAGQEVRVVVVADPRGDVVGDARQAHTIDVSEVRYKVKPRTPSFSVAVRYRRMLTADEGRQSFVADIRSGGKHFALVARANGYDSSADIYRVTDRGWKKTSAVVSYTWSFFSDRGFLQASVPTRFFLAETIDRVQTRLRLRDSGGRAVDRTSPHRAPISLHR